MNNVYGFFPPSVILGYILLIQRYPYKTCVFIGQEARYLDVVVALLHGLFMVICSVEHFYHFRPMWMNWSELYLLWFSVHILDFFMCMYAQKYKLYRCFLVQNAFFLVYLS